MSRCGWLTFSAVVLMIAGVMCIIAAVLAAISGLILLPYYPVWALIYVAMAVTVVYGLSAHFDEPASTQMLPCPGELHRAGATAARRRGSKGGRKGVERSPKNTLIPTHYFRNSSTIGNQ